MKKLFFFLIFLFILQSCSKSDRGELVGVQGKKFFPDKPSGMVLVPSGSFLMGMSDEDIVGLQNAPISTVSIKAFYMDETEITNGEYRQFVNWVKDSVVRQALAVRAMEEIGESPTQEELDKDNSINSFFPIYQPISEVSDEEKSGYELYREQNSFGINPYDKKTFNLNFDVDIIWEREEYPDLAYAEVMEGVIEGTGFYLPKEESYNSERIFDTKQIVYTYTTFDAEAAIKSNSETRKDFFKEKSIPIYPDTTAWIKDFSYSYNEPMHNDYFWHDAYSDYPVVGVSWEQAKAFVLRLERVCAGIKSRRSSVDFSPKDVEKCIDFMATEQAKAKTSQIAKKFTDNSNLKRKLDATESNKAKTNAKFKKIKKQARAENRVSRPSPKPKSQTSSADENDIVEDIKFSSDEESAED